MDIKDTPNGVAFTPQSASVDKLELILGNGKTIELKKIMIELSYYEDLYAFATSGYVKLRDGLGLLENLQITGKEYIDINFGNAKNGPMNIKTRMRVYKVGDRTPVGNMTSDFYTLYFCSEELVMSEQMKISKSFKGDKISDIVKHILIEKMKVPFNRINTIDSTIGVYDLIVPMLKPFEAISWVSTYARPSNTNLIGADMVFFENRYGFNFRSITDMMKQTPYKTYKYQQNNLDPKIKDFNEDSLSVLQYEFVKGANSLEETASGALANKTIVIDPLRRTYQVKEFSYKKYVEESGIGKGLIPESTNRLGVKSNETYDSVLKVVFGNSTENEIPAIKENQDSVQKDLFVEATLQYRTAQLALANHTVVKLLVPGDPGLTVGNTINFNFYSILNSKTRELDQIYSGRYLVTAVRHILQAQGVYQSVVEIAKESSKVALSPSNVSN